MSDWEDDYDAGGVAISKPLPVETVTLPVKSWRPPSPRGARSRETTSVGAKFGGDGEQWRNWRERDSEFNVCDGATGKNNSYSRSRTGPTGCRGGEDRSGSSPTTLNVENSLVGRIIGETQVSVEHLCMQQFFGAVKLCPLCSDVLCFSNESFENLPQNDSFKYSAQSVRVKPSQTHETTTDE